MPEQPQGTGDEVRYSTNSDGLPFAYRPHQIITTQLRRALEILNELGRRDEALGEGDLKLEYQLIDAGENEEVDDLDNDVPTPVGVAPGPVQEGPTWHDPVEDGPPSGEGAGGPAPDGPFFLVRGVRDPLGAIIELRARGVLAQPNHVYFSHHPAYANDEFAVSAGTNPPPAPARPVSAQPAHGGVMRANLITANPAYANPAYANPAYANPAYANPAYANPAYANPAYANPAYANPAYANPASATDAVIATSSVVPAAPGQTTAGIEKLLGLPPHDLARIFVLDTGLAWAGTTSPSFGALLAAPSSIRPLRSADADDRPTEPGQSHLAFAAGHGTFIATLIAQVAPGCRVGVGKVLSNSGVGDEWTIARRIHALTARLRHRPERQSSVLSLSFGAPVLDHPYLMAQVVSAIQSIGVVVVASAGNEATSQPMFPAALPGVIGVGAVGPAGPAPFTNYGPWVSACAPGVDLVSGFFRWDGGPGLHFADWAIWSGTSFSAPIVAATLARFIMTAPALLGHPVTGHGARHHVVDAPWLMRIPGLGTVINVV